MKKLLIALGIIILLTSLACEISSPNIDATIEAGINERIDNPILTKGEVTKGEVIGLVKERVRETTYQTYYDPYCNSLLAVEGEGRLAWQARFEPTDHSWVVSIDYIRNGERRYMFWTYYERTGAIVSGQSTC
jgi:hypothetical protein